MHTRTDPRILVALGLLGLAGGTSAAPFQLNYLGQNIVPTGTQFQGTTVGGLSGIDFDAANNRFFAIADDRSALNPARFYTLSLDLSQFNRNVTPGNAGVTFTAFTPILRPDGSTFPTNTVDPESLRLRNGQLFWANEGQRSAAGFQNPTVREMNADGSFVRDFDVPAHYNPVGTVGALNPADAGIRNNLAFESLTFGNDGEILYTATENSLAQDDPLPATVLNGSENRVLAFDAGNGTVLAEYVYLTDPVADMPIPVTNFATNGLVELLNVPGLTDTFLAVERSFSTGIPGTGNDIWLYLTSTAGATDVQAFTDLDNAGAYTRMSKELLLDLSDLRNIDNTPVALDNIEGITWGPTLSNGQASLILVSDNNFSGTQFTQFLAFSVTPVPVPAALPLLASALGLAGIFGRRVRQD